MDPRRFYLGAVTIAPRSDLKRYLETPLEEPAAVSLRVAMQVHLETTLGLPRADERTVPPTPETTRSTCMCDITKPGRASST